MEDDLRQGDAERALATGARAVALYPRGAPSNGAYALALALTGSEAEAVEHLRASLAADPDGYGSLRNLGNAVRFLASERRWLALAAVANVMAAAHPRDARPLVALGRAYREMGRADQARAALEQALRVDPQSSAAKEELARISP
jgi:tetratricopeptide (TPR) repeat protein